MTNRVRLTKEEIEIVKSTIKAFDKEAKIILFGSRADLTKKGGDIDIFIETKRNISLDDKLDILTEIEMAGILRKVDLTIKTPDSEYQPIFETISKEGVIL